MRARQAKKIVKMVMYTPIDRMSDKWFERALSYACIPFRQSQIEKAMRYYYNGICKGLVKPYPYKPKHTPRNKRIA